MEAERAGKRAVINHYQPVKTEEVMLKYHYKRNTEGESCDVNGNYEISIAARTANYTPYELACFKSKLNAYLSPRGQYCNMIFKQRGSGDMWQFLEIYDKNGFVPITPEMKDELKIVVDRLTNFEPQHMVVFDLRSNITYQTPNLSAGWMRGVIPHLLLPTNIRSSSSTNLETLPFIEGGLVYARFSDKFKYKDLAAKYETWIRNVLTMLYVEGCIVLDPILDSEFIAKWKLERWNIMNGLVLSPGHNLYKMSWNNSLVAPQKTLFLQNIYGNDGSSVNVNGRVVNCREGGYDDLERFIASVS